MTNQPGKRDYLGEMHAKITALTQGSDWIPARVAQDLFTQLLDTDPDLLNGWITERVVHFLHEEITQQTRKRNGHARSRAARFGKAAKNYEDAVTEEERIIAGENLSLFFAEHAVDAKNTRKQALEMTGTEHLYVATTTYRVKGNRLLMLAAFHEAIAERIGDQRTGDVLTEEQYIALFTSIVTG
jgi:hypothetical protein